MHTATHNVTTGFHQRKQVRAKEGEQERKKPGTVCNLNSKVALILYICFVTCQKKKLVFFIFFLFQEELKVHHGI